MDLDLAEKYINEALTYASGFPELIDSGIYHANKGLILLKRNLYEDASRFCKHAMKIATQTQNGDGKEQAEYCLKQIDKFIGKNKKK